MRKAMLLPEAEERLVITERADEEVITTVTVEVVGDAHLGAVAGDAADIQRQGEGGRAAALVAAGQALQREGQGVRRRVDRIALRVAQRDRIGGAEQQLPAIAQAQCQAAVAARLRKAR